MVRLCAKILQYVNLSEDKEADNLVQWVITSNSHIPPAVLFYNQQLPCVFHYCSLSDYCLGFGKHKSESGDMQKAERII